jgi:hypothetical protein
MKRFTKHLLAAVLAGLFGLFLTYGSLTSTDFPLGIYSCPTDPDVPFYWLQYDSLQQNLVRAGRIYWNEPFTTLTTFLRAVASCTAKVVLTRSDWNFNRPGWNDTIPYLVHYYSAGQYDQIGVDWDSGYAAENLYIAGQTYCFFRHDAGDSIIENFPDEGGVLLCEEGACQDDSGKFAIGCYWTYRPEGTPAWWTIQSGEPRMGIDFFDYGDSLHFGRFFITRFRAAIDTSQGVADEDTVLIYDNPYFYNNNDSSLYEHHYIYVTKGQFEDDRVFGEFEIEAFADTNYHRMQYRFYTTNACDIYVDWVEYMDKDAQLAIAKLKGQGVDQQRQEAAYAAER